MAKFILCSVEYGSQGHLVLRGQDYQILSKFPQNSPAAKFGLLAEPFKSLYTMFFSIKL